MKKGLFFLLIVAPISACNERAGDASNSDPNHLSGADDSDNKDDNSGESGDSVLESSRDGETDDQDNATDSSDIDGDGDAIDLSEHGGGSETTDSDERADTGNTDEADAGVADQTCNIEEIVDVDAFVELEKNTICADISNRFFVIDCSLVFWDRRGSCPDNGYSFQLFGTSPDDVYCSQHDSIAGPVGGCQDDAFEDLFSALTAFPDLDDPNLGFDSNHGVELLAF